ncbi:MAG: isochorismatase family protein [Candidatus Altiarchaeales archaeon]|nr:isochorismatase family protein [Candidatus Altiarchaeales archaeon]MBD3416152.1 isochorismatase family protein [Candidatus Altiarchaeales archaeon]
MHAPLKADNTVLVVVDMQEKFKPVIRGWDGVVDNVVKLVKGFKVLGVPVVHTEQYPKGLGRTVPKLSGELDGDPIEKLHFSCFGDDGFCQRLGELQRENIVLCGIEAHVCLLKTTLDALDRGYSVHYVLDGTSSRRPLDKEVAVERVIQAGAYTVTSEMVLFQLLDRSGTEEFTEISKLVK